MMRPYDVLSVQRGLDGGQLQIEGMTLSMFAGAGRRHGVSEAAGRHVLETGPPAGFSRKQVETVFEEIRVASESAVAVVVLEMPKGFPEALFASVRNGVDRRLVRMLSRKNDLGSID